MLRHKYQFAKTSGLFLILLAILNSCSNPETDLSEYGEVFKTVVKSDQGVFRGYFLGDPQESVQVSETGEPVEVDNGYLYYEYPIDTLGLFNITYNFDEKGLKEIQSEIYISEADSVESIVNKFKSYFDFHYGKSQTQMGYNVWTVKSDKYSEIRISLSDESVNFANENAPGKISLWVYPTID